jgi:hypothetical protein
MVLAMTVAATVISMTADAAAQAGGGWLLVVPPPAAEKRTMMKLYGAGSEAEVQAAVARLPEPEQERLVTKVYEILLIPAASARTEALLDALQDPSAPVNNWRAVETFDSSSACERERQRTLQKFESAAARVRAASPDGDELAFEDWTLFEGLTTSRLSRCVPESTFVAR